MFGTKWTRDHNGVKLETVDYYFSGLDVYNGPQSRQLPEIIWERWADERIVWGGWGNGASKGQGPEETFHKHTARPASGVSQRFDTCLRKTEI